MNTTTPIAQPTVEIPPPTRVNPAPEPVNPVASGQDKIDSAAAEAEADSDAATRNTVENKDDDIGNDPVEQISPEFGKDVEGM